MPTAYNPKVLPSVATGEGKFEKEENLSLFVRALEFKERFDFPAKVAISFQGTRSATIKYDDEKTNPNVTLRGVDENYLESLGLGSGSWKEFHTQ